MNFFRYLRTHATAYRWKVCKRRLGWKYQTTKNTWLFSGNKIEFFLLLQAGHHTWYIGYFR